jgi:hypothetical protein
MGRAGELAGGKQPQQLFLDEPNQSGAIQQRVRAIELFRLRYNGHGGSRFAHDRERR